VLAKELTREALYAALKARCWYAMTGARMLLDFGVDDVLMGDTAQGQARPRGAKSEAKVAGTAPLERAEILRDNEVVYAHPPDGFWAAVTWRDVPTSSGSQTFCAGDAG